MKKAIITGITGQDGAYLTGLLLDKGYKVFGAFRRTSSVNFWRLQELGLMGHTNLELVEFDLTDQGGTVRLLQQCEPDEIYNLAAQSFVGVSLDQPITAGQITDLGAVDILKNTATFRKWVGVELSEDNHKQFLAPPRGLRIASKC
jgi:GDPmannose 4,6-dehydratase